MYREPHIPSILDPLSSLYNTDTTKTNRDDFLGMDYDSDVIASDSELSNDPELRHRPDYNPVIEKHEGPPGVAYRFDSESEAYSEYDSAQYSEPEPDSVTSRCSGSEEDWDSKRKASDTMDLRDTKGKVIGAIKGVPVTEYALEEIKTVDTHFKDGVLESLSFDTTYPEDMTLRAETSAKNLTEKVFPRLMAKQDEEIAGQPLELTFIAHRHEVERLSNMPWDFVSQTIDGQQWTSVSLGPFEGDLKGNGRWIDRIVFETVDLRLCSEPSLT